MIKKILAAVDFSDCAAVALQRAKALAGSTEAELVVVYANELPVVPTGDPSFMPAYVLEERIRHGRERFAELVSALQRDVNARGFTEVGPAQEVIAAAITRERPDLVIAGTHSRRAVSRFFLGSFAERLVRTSTVPVLIVRATEAASDKESDS